MKELYQKALKAYLEMFEIHMNTKTTDKVFHEATEWFYETLFDVAHKVWERYVDKWGKLNELSLDEQKKRANEIIQNLRKDLEDFAENNELSLWTEDLIGWLADEIEDLEWTAKSVL